MNTQLPSRFQIGERVKLTVIQTAPIFGYVKEIIFTESAVRYSLWIEEAQTTLHNIESGYVDEAPEAEREMRAAARHLRSRGAHLAAGARCRAAGTASDPRRRDR